MTPNPDAPVLERHRRMAVALVREGSPPLPSQERWTVSGNEDDLRSHGGYLPDLAQFAATLERDAKAEGLREALREAIEEHRCYMPVSSEWMAVGRVVQRIRALLPEPPRTGPELAAKHGFPPLAESGAARVPGVPEPPRGEACTCTLNRFPYRVRVPSDTCPVHGTKEG